MSLHLRRTNKGGNPMERANSKKLQKIGKGFYLDDPQEWFLLK